MTSNALQAAYIKIGESLGFAHETGDHLPRIERLMRQGASYFHKMVNERQSKGLEFTQELFTLASCQIALAQILSQQSKWSECQEKLEELLPLLQVNDPWFTMHFLYVTTLMQLCLKKTERWDEFVKVSRAAVLRIEKVKRETPAFVAPDDL